jgi:hypothetical protein
MRSARDAYRLWHFVLLPGVIAYAFVVGSGTAFHLGFGSLRLDFFRLLRIAVPSTPHHQAISGATNRRSCPLALIPEQASLFRAFKMLEQTIE